MNEIAALISAIASAVSAIVAVLMYLESKKQPQVHKVNQSQKNSSQSSILRFQRAIDYARKYNKEVSVYEWSLFAIMVAIGIYVYSETGEFWYGVLGWIASGFILGHTVWELVVRNGAANLKNVIEDLNLENEEKKALAVELNAIKWNKRTNEYVKPIINSIQR